MQKTKEMTMAMQRMHDIANISAQTGHMDLNDIEKYAPETIGLYEQLHEIMKSASEFMRNEKKTIETKIVTKTS